MNWIDALRLRPIRDGGVYVLACPAPDGGVEIMLGSYRGEWRSGGKTVPAIYFAEVGDLPADTHEKAKQISDALQEPGLIEDDKMEALPSTDEEALAEE